MEELKRKRPKYMVFVYEGCEGWIIHEETDDWEKAVKIYNQEVRENDRFGVEVLLVTECLIELDHPDIKKQADWQQAVK